MFKWFKKISGVRIDGILVGGRFFSHMKGIGFLKNKKARKSFPGNQGKKVFLLNEEVFIISSLTEKILPYILIPPTKSFILM